MKRAFAAFDSLMQRTEEKPPYKMEPAKLRSVKILKWACPALAPYPELEKRSFYQNTKELA